MEANRVLVSILCSSRKLANGAQVNEAPSCTRLIYKNFFILLAKSLFYSKLSPKIQADSGLASVPITLKFSIFLTLMSPSGDGEIALVKKFVSQIPNKIEFWNVAIQFVFQPKPEIGAHRSG